MNAKQQQMCAMLMRLAPNEGYTASRLENVRFMRADRPLPRTPVLYEPGIIIVCGAASAVISRTAFTFTMRNIIWCCRCRFPSIPKLTPRPKRPCSPSPCGWIWPKLPN